MVPEVLPPRIQGIWEDKVSDQTHNGDLLISHPYVVGAQLPQIHHSCFVMDQIRMEMGVYGGHG
jgi:hypothetical protein